MTIGNDPHDRQTDEEREGGARGRRERGTWFVHSFLFILHTFPLEHFGHLAVLAAAVGASNLFA